MAAPAIDTHAHVFHRGLAVAEGARYVPGYDAPLAAYLAHLDRIGAERGVLVQPSFLGSDNGFLVACLDAAGGQLAGVVVLEDGVDPETGAALAAAGVVGARFNLVGRTSEVLASAGARATLAACARLGWHIELHADAGPLQEALRHLAGFDGPIVVDHFGRPPPGDDAALAAVLALSDDPRARVKLSAPYRVPGWDIPALAARFLEAFGPERLLWGSDWPWTQFETRVETSAILPPALGIDAASLAVMDRAAEALFFPARG